MLAVVGAVAPVAAAARVPRVVLVVGPVGSLTNEYRSLANAAAAEAVAAGAEVTKVYSPNATWPAVRHALNGASIVVYLGHGNGWPSPYRDSLYPPTQNGFGLNPVAGSDDVNHQYFGEASVDNIKLAPNAVVVLSHLCYASGNSEPGLAEGTENQAIQRVDNYAAGFIRAGAQAVVAEAHLGPAYYVRSLLRSQMSIEQIWRSSPGENGNTMTLASQRSPGFAERLDPDNANSGFYRSLVSRGISSTQVRSGGTGTASGTTVSSVIQPPVAPSLTTLGLSFGQVNIRSLPIASASSQLVLPVASGGAKRIPSGTQVGIRWDPIVLDPPPPPPSSTLPTADPPASPSPSPSDSPGASPTASPTPTPSPSAAPIDPPDVDLVVPEQQGSVVTLNPAARNGKGLNVGVTYPSAPGLYRLVVTLHDPAGVAYDAPTQAMVSSVLVRVGGAYTAAFGAPTSLSLATGSPSTLGVRVVNAGSQGWDAPSTTPPAESDALLIWLRTSRTAARLVGTWVSTEGLPVPAPVSRALDPTASAPGGTAAVGLPLVAPTQPGQYLLLLDVVTPTHGALSTLGSTPSLIRVSVTGAAIAPPPSPSPAGSTVPSPAP
ncbi:MAG TPA: hypothetical protein VGM28_09855 [Candidatus Limnocylindrales bacterium]|jgi:hypothetical protein